MKELQLLTTDTVIRVLGWALIQFLWQGSLVALLLRAVLTLARR